MKIWKIWFLGWWGWNQCSPRDYKRALITRFLSHYRLSAFFHIESILCEMKFSGDFIPLVIPFLNLGSNITGNHHGSSLQPVDHFANVSHGLPTYSLGGAAPLQTHHHHEEHRDDEHRDQDRDRWERRDEHHREHRDHRGHYLRPKAGDASIGVGSAYGGETSAECPQPPVLSCSPQAASTDACCVCRAVLLVFYVNYYSIDVIGRHAWRRPSPCSILGPRSWSTRFVGYSWPLVRHQHDVAIQSILFCPLGQISAVEVFGRSAIQNVHTAVLR